MTRDYDSSEEWKDEGMMNHFFAGKCRMKRDDIEPVKRERERRGCAVRIREDAIASVAQVLMESLK